MSEPHAVPMIRDVNSAPGESVPPPLAEELARFVAETKAADLPPVVLAKVADHVLDTLGVAVAAVGSDFCEAAWAALDRLGSQGPCTCIGRKAGAAAPWAALVNGTLAHGLDYDDTHAEAVVHVSAPVVAAALAQAEASGATGTEFLTAVALGMEVSARVGLAAPGAFHDRGFHPTPIAGTFGATAAAARLLGLDALQTRFALGLAASQAAGTLEFLGDGSWSKRLHAGWAAHAGVVAAAFGQAGFIGPRGALDGRFGLYRTHLGEEGWSREAVSGGLGEHWRLLEISIKPYPACHMTHACIDAARALRAQTGAPAEQVARIECFVHERVFPVICEPRAAKVAPRTDYEAKFSLPYTVAAMFVRGQLGIDDFTPAAIADPAVRALAERVVCLPDPGSAYPRYFDGRVRLVLRSGAVYEHAERINRGHPERPLARAEVVEKFRANTARVLPDRDAEGVLRWLAATPQQAPVRRLGARLRAKRGGFAEQ